jgi:hypothetical protein
MTVQGYYDKLNTDTPLVINLGDTTISVKGPGHMQALVSAVIESNYGLHRFLSELVSQFEAHDVWAYALAERELLAALRSYLS